MKPGRVARASEAIAASLLEDMGFRVKGVRVKVEVSGVEVGEVDILAEKGGETYAVEVKAGALDVSGVRQAYVNAQLLGAKPLVVARGLADDSARVLAERLGVEVITLPDSLPLTPEEVHEAVKHAVLEALEELASRLFNCPTLTREEAETLEAVAASETIKEAGERLGVTVEDLAGRLGSLRRRGILQGGSYKRLRVQASLTLLCRMLRERGGAAVPRP
ncbi:restriction endonuclease [Stetteria hydrogenophila]